MTLLKLRNTRMADSAGKLISADVSRAPTRFMALFQRQSSCRYSASPGRAASGTVTPASRAHRARADREMSSCFALGFMGLV